MIGISIVNWKNISLHMKQNFKKRKFDRFKIISILILLGLFATFLTLLWRDYEKIDTIQDHIKENYKVFKSVCKTNDVVFMDKSFEYVKSINHSSKAQELCFFDDGDYILHFYYDFCNVRKHQVGLYLDGKEIPLEKELFDMKIDIRNGIYFASWQHFVIISVNKKSQKLVMKNKETGKVYFTIDINLYQKTQC